MSASEQKGSQTIHRRRLLKGFSAALLYWLVCFAVLCVVFPIWEQVSYVLFEYVLMSSLVAFIVIVLVPLLTWWCKRLSIWISVMIRVMATFAILAYIAGSIGNSPELINYGPTAEISGFFAEWRFISFVLVYGTIVSVLAGVYYWWIGRPTGVPPSSPKGHATRGRAHEP